MQNILKTSVNTDYLQAILLFLVFFPLFYQLTGNIFTNQGFVYESYGKLLLLPLPIASIFCFIAIACLLRIEENHFGVGIVFSTFILMILSTVIASNGSGSSHLAKLILMIQFILPMFAFVLGRLYREPKSNYLKIEAIALYILVLIIPTEVVSTLLRGSGFLSPDLYLFSLYQHLQYLPVIFIGLYFLAINTFHMTGSGKLKYGIIFLTPWMGIYIAASISILAYSLALLGTVMSVFFFYKKGQLKVVGLLMIVIWAGFALYYPAVQMTTTDEQKFEHLAQASEGSQASEESNFLLPNNITERFGYWAYYASGIIESPKVFMFGHEKRPDRNAFPSAHNYYLDLIYNFGFAAVLPLLGLIFLTMKGCYRVLCSESLTPKVAILTLLVMFFIFADNLMKVSFRQPYPGMVMFFLWGLLLTRLEVSER